MLFVINTNFFHLNISGSPNDRLGRRHLYSCQIATVNQESDVNEKYLKTSMAMQKNDLEFIWVIVNEVFHNQVQDNSSYTW